MKRQRRIRAGRKPGSLVYFEPEPMPQGMSESIAESPGGDHLAGQGIAFTAGHPRSQMLYSPALSRLHHSVNQPLPLVGPGPHHHGQGQISAVPIQLGTEVHQEEVSRVNRPRAGAGVRQGRTLTRRDNGWERVPLAPSPAQNALQV